MNQLNSRNLTFLPNLPTLTLVEYGDYSCPLCQKLNKVLTPILPLYEGRIQFTFRYFPNLQHPSAFFMALIAEAARRQGKFEATHKALFGQTHPVTLGSLPELAQKVGLNLSQLLADMQNEGLKDGIWKDIQAGQFAGVTNTPTLFLGPYRLQGKMTQARLLSLLNHYVNRPSVLSTVDPDQGLIRWSSAA